MIKNKAKSLSDLWYNYLAKNNLFFMNKDRESEFFEYYIGSTTTATQIFMVIGGLTFWSYVSLDELVDPGNHFLANQLRTFFSTPLIMISAFLLFFKYFRKKVEYIVIFSAFIIILAQALIFSSLHNGYQYATGGFAIMFIIRAINYVVRITYLLIVAIFAFIGAVGGCILANNTTPDWLIVNAIGVLTAITLGVVAALARERRARRQFMANRELARSRTRAEALIGSLLPGTMVQRIRAGEKDIADVLNEVSIVFADIADFTSLSKRLSPTDLIRLLDDIFSRFDRAAELWGMEKITTVGDAYMAIGGMHYPEERREIAITATRFALEIKKEIEQVIQESGYPINVRVGIHIGPVVIGVVGDRRPTFDCWGDTVRIASSLEGQAAVGAILISNPVFEALGDMADVGSMQKISIKDVDGKVIARELRGLRL
jgi:class 3 adenylate cyclase